MEGWEAVKKGWGGRDRGLGGLTCREGTLGGEGGWGGREVELGGMKEEKEQGRKIGSQRGMMFDD